MSSASGTAAAARTGKSAPVCWRSSARSWPTVSRRRSGAKSPSWSRRELTRRIMLARVLEPEVMDSAEEARDYDAMDHAQVNRVFVADFLAFFSSASATPLDQSNLLDVGTGTAQIPIELCRQAPPAGILGIDLAEHMLAVGRQNVARAGFDRRLRLPRLDATSLPLDVGP